MTSLTELAKNVDDVLNASPPPSATTAANDNNKDKDVDGGGRWVTDLSFDELRTEIGRSFAGTDSVPGEPTMSWCINHLHGVDGVFPEEDGRDGVVQMITFMCTYEVREATSRPYLALSKRVDGDGDDDKGVIASTAIVSEYDASKVWWWTNLCKSMRKFVLSMKLYQDKEIPEVFLSSEPDLKVASQRCEKKGAAYLDNLASWHAQYGPNGKHWYVNFVATNPDLQGQGNGSELMRKLGELADAARTDCYLECGSEKNRDFYRKFGYDVSGQQLISDPTVPEAETKTAYFMVRKAQ